jgi:hypothetical protein
MDMTIGDKGSYLYINFGAFGAHEDNPRRAVRMALELRASVSLDLQIGITQGLMFVGTYGGTTRRTYGAIGDDVNLAARLMMTADAGEILMSGHVHQAVASHFVSEPRSPLPLKGKAEPLPVFALTGERQQRSLRLQEPTYGLPMVGRTQELQTISEKLDLAASGRSQVIGIVAEAGLGKSRLTAEVIRIARRRGFAGWGEPASRTAFIHRIWHGKRSGTHSLISIPNCLYGNKSACSKGRSKIGCPLAWKLCPC